MPLISISYSHWLYSWLDYIFYSFALQLVSCFLLNLMPSQLNHMLFSSICAFLLHFIVFGILTNQFFCELHFFGHNVSIVRIYFFQNDLNYFVWCHLKATTIWPIHFLTSPNLWACDLDHTAWLGLIWNGTCFLSILAMVMD